MRNGQAWRNKLVRELNELQKSYGLLPPYLPPTTLLDTELVLTLLVDYLPEEDPTLAWAILGGHHFPALNELNPEARRAITLTRLRLPDLLGRGKWERDFEAYQVLSLKSPYSLYRFEENKILYRPTPILPKRLEAMREALRTAPTWKPVANLYAGEGLYRFYLERAPFEVEIGGQIAKIPKQHQAVPLSMNAAPQSGDEIKVSLAELEETARWMDKQLSKHPDKINQRWEQRLQAIQLCLIEQNKGLLQSDKLNFRGLLHLIGMVGSGKSSFFTVLTVHLARQGKRVTLVQSDVASLLREQTTFEALRSSDPHLLAVPLIGRSTRLTHLNRLYVVEAQKDQPRLAPKHPAFRYLDTICPLDGLRRDAYEPIKPGLEPCNNLFLLENDADDETDIKIKEAEKVQKEEREARKFDCPILPVCPVHAPTRNLNEALIWLATPASLLASKPQSPLVAEEVRNIELVIRHSDLILVDEADLVQVQFDNRFAPIEVLIGKQDSWLDKLANQVTRQIYKPGRPLVGRNASLDRWLTAHQNLQRAADRLYFWLRESKANREWFKEPAYFSGNRILQKVADEVKADGLPIEAFKTAQEAFNRDPLGSYPNPKHPASPSQWTNAIRFELLAANSMAARAELESWFRQLSSELKLSAAKLELLCHRLLLALVVNVLDHALQDVVDLWGFAAQYLELEHGTGGLFYQPDDNLVKLVPEPGMGAVLGFQYYDPQNSGEGELRFFQIRGIGRALLYHLHDAYHLSDGVARANVILSSGTSFAPHSWRYHLQPAPDAILLPKHTEKVAPIECFFEPQTDPDNPTQQLYVSGKTDKVERSRSLRAMVKELSRPRGAKKLSKFEQELERLPEERRRILLVTGSYVEAETVGEALAYELQQRGDSPELVLTLIPDSDAELDINAPQGKLYRSMVQHLAEQNARYLVAPLQAIERGHNILVGQTAALGSIYFLTRPMPLPGDTKAVVQQLNAWSLEKAAHRPEPTLGLAGKKLRMEAGMLWEATLDKYETYLRLNEADRRALLWTQLVMVWQSIGRLLRGGVSARVHFVDAKWLPASANLIEGNDTWETSMVIGFRNILHEALNDKSQANRAIAEALYGAFAKALDNMKGQKDGR